MFWIVPVQEREDTVRDMWWIVTINKRRDVVRYVEWIGTMDVGSLFAMFLKWAQWMKCVMSARCGEVTKFKNKEYFPEVYSELALLNEQPNGITRWNCSQSFLKSPNGRTRRFCQRSMVNWPNWRSVVDHVVSLNCPMEELRDFLQNVWWKAQWKNYINCSRHMSNSANGITASVCSQCFMKWPNGRTGTLHSLCAGNWSKE